MRFWDFLFYASFGFVVTSSVAIAGVLLVFCYLIVPSVGAMLYAENDRPAAGHRLDHGDAGVGAGRISVAEDRSADGRDHRVHVRAGADPDGGAARRGAQGDGVSKRSLAAAVAEKTSPC